MDGITSTKKIIQAHKEYKKLNPQKEMPKPVIYAMTAYADKQTVENCIRSGMQGIIYKPFNKEGLK